jgi:hypothetical protein
MEGDYTFNVDLQVCAISFKMVMKTDLLKCINAAKENTITQSQKCCIRNIFPERYLKYLKILPKYEQVKLHYTKECYTCIYISNQQEQTKDWYSKI